MRTVFCQFRNEEYLLPFWLRHHREIFDHGVMINYASTDASCDIIRQLAPQWEIIPSVNKVFESIEVDMEIAWHEKRFEGWKTSLNVTEFMCAASLDRVEARIEAADLLGAHMRGVFMVDPKGHSLPDPVPEKSLIAQRSFGLFEDETISWAAMFRRWGFGVKTRYRRSWPTRISTRPFLLKKKDKHTLRSRLYHRAPHGAYLNGRHETQWRERCIAPQDDFLLLWFRFSPWNEIIRRRITSTGDLVSKMTKKFEPELPHIRYQNREDTLMQDYNQLARRARDLAKDPVFQANTAPWRGKA